MPQDRARDVVGAIEDQAVDQRLPESVIGAGDDAEVDAGLGADLGNAGQQGRGHRGCGQFPRCPQASAMTTPIALNFPARSRRPLRVRAVETDGPCGRLDAIADFGAHQLGMDEDVGDGAPRNSGRGGDIDQASA